MFNNLFKQFVRDSKQIKLTKEEKSQTRDQLLNFIETNPVSNNFAPRHQSWSNILSTNLFQTKFMPALLSIILTLSVATGITFASQGSLPGDALYPVKIKSEEVRSALTFSAESKAKLETELAQERLQEAEELSDETKLDEDVRTQLEDNFEEHADRMEERTAEFSSVDARAAASISSNFEVSLKAHDRILSKLAEDKDGKTAPQIGKLLIKVRAKTKSANHNKLLFQSRENSKIDVKIDSKSKDNDSLDNENHVNGNIQVKLGQ